MLTSLVILVMMMAVIVLEDPFGYVGNLDGRYLGRKTGEASKQTFVPDVLR